MVAGSLISLYLSILLMDDTEGMVAGSLISLYLSILLMDDTDGMVAGSQTLWLIRMSLISQAKSAGCSPFSRIIRFTTEGVATCCRESNRVTSMRKPCQDKVFTIRV